MEKWEKELRKKRSLEGLIINRPEAMKTTRRHIEFSLTTIGWAIWFFLCRPLLILMLWFLSFRIFFRHMIDLGGLAGLQELKIVYISIIIFIVFLVRGWNVYNKMRFGKKTRRKLVHGVSDKRLEEYFKLPEGSAHRLQNTKTMEVEFLDKHQLLIQDSERPSIKFNGHFKPS